MLLIHPDEDLVINLYKKAIPRWSHPSRNSFFYFYKLYKLK